MITADKRSKNEIKHGLKLASTGDPEKLWNWSSPAGQVRAQRRARLITTAANLQPGMQVLEIGCGTGLFTELMAVSGAHILAVDISPDLLQIARQRGLPSDQVKFAEMRFEDGKMDGPFDAIVGSSVLHHLDIPLALRHIYALLKPEGVMVFAEPNMINPQVWAERNVGWIREKLGVSPDETAINRWELAQDLREIGFVEVAIRTTDFLHPATPRALIPVVYQLGLILEYIPLVREIAGSVLIRAQRPV